MCVVQRSSVAILARARRGAWGRGQLAVCDCIPSTQLCVSAIVVFTMYMYIHVHVLRTLLDYGKSDSLISTLHNTVYSTFN